MFFYGLFTLVLSLSFTVATYTFRDLKNETEESILGKSSSFSNSCGGVLSAAGAISSKQFETVDPNDVCVWIIRIPCATRYTGSVVKANASSTLIISSFGYDSTTTHVIPNSSFNISASVLVITFTSSNYTNNLGFYLTFSGGITDGHEPASSTSKDHLLSANSIDIRYPAAKAQYSSLETTLFVFKPVRNQDGQLKKTQILYVKDELEGISCWDALNVFTFDCSRAGISKWKYLGRICGDVDSKNITNQDFILIHFQSDTSFGSRGFHLYVQTIS